jgi:nucleotide-binding universal stress UspA family protein
MKKLRETYTPGHAYPVEYRITQGDAAAEILRLAEETKCDLIAMGTHGRTGLERLVVGSVAETVMRKAHCPVLTVRSPSSAHAPTADRNPPAAVIA